MDLVGFSDLPGEILTNPEFTGLSNENKMLVYLTYKAQTATNAGAKEDLQKALDFATSSADPYFKEKSRIVQDEINRSVGTTTANVKSKVDSANERIKQLTEDLTYNKENLSLEQQQELADQLRKNKEDLFGLQQQAAESGLAFSSPRKEAEAGLMAQQQGISESTARKYARLNRSEDLNASRGIAELNRGIADTERAGTEQLTSIQRAGEKTLGSGQTPSVSGVSSMGGVTGTLQEDRQNQINDLIQTYKQFQNPFTFKQ